MTTPFLSGFRVLDLSQYIPGPFATRQLADLGADVLKIEPPHGDPMRFFMMPDNSKQSPLYKHLNRGKRIVRLNLKSEKGKKQLEQLITEADVLMESFRPGVMAKLGFNPDTLKRLNPRLVHCALSGFGQTGPYRDQAGHDLTYCAASGSLTLAGTEARPTMPFPPLADHAGAMQAVNAIQAALLGRSKSGEGAFLDISLYESALSWQYLTLNPAEPEATRNREASMLNGGLACYNIYQTADKRFVALAPLEEKFWVAFCKAIQKESWIERHYETPHPQTKLISELRTLFASETAQHWQETLINADCCFELIPTLDEIKQHPQTIERGMLHDWEPAYAARVNGIPCDLGAEPNDLGEADQISWN